MEFAAKCTLCDWSEAWTTQAASEASAVWHVHDQHSEAWIEVIGSDRPPDVTRPPDAYGRRFEQWERQS